MKFKSIYGFSNERTVYGLSDIVELQIDRAPDYHAGEIESLRARLDKAVEILIAISGALPDEKQCEIARGLGFSPAD